MTALPISQRAAQLRRDFDRSFAEPRRLQRALSVDLLAVRVGSDACVLRLSAIAAVFIGGKLTPLPDATPEFLGIVGFRGTLMPVFDLRVLLGCPGADVPRWLAAVAASPVALAFDALDGTLRLPLDAIAPRGPGAPAQPHVRELVRVAASDAPLRPLIDVESVAAGIRQRLRPDHSPSRQE